MTLSSVILHARFRGGGEYHMQHINGKSANGATYTSLGQRPRYAGTTLGSTHITNAATMFIPLIYMDGNVTANGALDVCVR